MNVPLAGSAVRVHAGLLVVIRTASVASVEMYMFFIHADRIEIINAVASASAHFLITGFVVDRVALHGKDRQNSTQCDQCDPFGQRRSFS